MWEWVSCHSNSCHTGSGGNDGTMVVTLVVWTGPSVHGAGDVEAVVILSVMMVCSMSVLQDRP